MAVFGRRIIFLKNNKVMRLIFIFCSLLFSMTIFAQDKVKVIKVVNKDLGVEELISVLKVDKSIKQGHYQKNINGKLAVDGQYDNNTKIGVWKFLEWDGTCYLSYDYSLNKIIDFKIDTAKQLIIQNKDTILKRVDRPVLYNGSKIEFQNNIVRSIRYPQLAVEHGISGKVLVGIVIDENGSVESYYIVKSDDNSLNEESLRVVKGFKGNWIPAILDGVPIKSVFVYPIVFRLQE